MPDSLSVVKTDYVEFIDNYAIENKFSYNEGPTDDSFKEYNISNFVKYGDGIIRINNDFLQRSNDIVQSDFSSPISYINRQFGNLSLERTTIFEYKNAQAINITGISNNSGVARFAISNSSLQPGVIVKIEMDSLTNYDGEWIVTDVGSGYFEVAEIPYMNSDSGTATVQIVKTTSDSNVYLFLNAGLKSLTDFSTTNKIYIKTTQYNYIAYSYFNLLNINKPINIIFTQGLSWQRINNQLSYQRSLIDTYWQSFIRILNDPAKQYMKGTMDKLTFKQLTPLIPVEIETEKTSNKYYINRITAYKNSYSECTIELIKL